MIKITVLEETTIKEMAMQLSIIEEAVMEDIIKE